ncbi:transposase [Azotobacter chroococcum]|uniref:transposase n=1 Tax=Azotobacter chroococcum TaxID=353 RepID=UPI001B8B597E|nr:transposase [Azotobacter chroococcum]
MLGFQDEVWWSRFARPSLKAWSAGPALRLQQLSADPQDAEPKALSCYGLLRADTGQMLLVSQVTEDFLEWVCERLASKGKKALLMIRDNASWHVSHRVRAWIGAHNRRTRAEGGVRIVTCRLPSKSPWLNRIEPAECMASGRSMNPNAH